MKKKLLAILLTMCMVLSTAPAALAAEEAKCAGGDGCTHQAAIGTTHYDTLSDALTAAKDGDTIELIYAAGDDPVSMAGSVCGNKTVTITGTAQVDWSKGWLFVGRGGEGDGTLIFEDATLTSNDDSLSNGSYGIHVSAPEKDAADKNTGKVIFKNSDVQLSYLANRSNVEVDGGELYVHHGFWVGGRPASETPDGTDGTATMDIKNDAVVEVKNHNGMGIGYESKGVLNVNGATFEYTGTEFVIREGGECNVTNATFTATTLTTNKNLFISGDSVVQIENLVGRATVMDDTTLTDSYIKSTTNGTTRVLGDLTLNGGFGAGYLMTAGSTTGTSGYEGTITIEDGTAVDVSYGVEMNGDLTLDGGTIELSGGNASGGIWGCVFQSGEFVVNSDIVVTGNTGTAPIYFTNATATINGNISQSNSGGEPIYIKNSTVTVTEDASVTTDCAVYVNAAGTLESAGDITGTVKANAADAVIKITDGTVDGTISKVDGANVTVTGGTFSENPSAYLANEYYQAVYSNITGKYSVVLDATVGNMVAEVNGVQYPTLAEALEAAKAGDTVTLLADVTADSTVNINKSITLDGDSHKISGTASPLLKLDRAANITVQNATLTSTNNVVRWNYVNEGYTHTYQNCQISGGVYGIHYDGNGGEVVIDGCTIDGFNAFAGTLAQVTVKNTTFDADQSSYAGANFWGNTVIENVTLVDEGKTTWLDVKTVAEVIGGKVVKGDTESSLESYLDAAAKIGDVYYDTLQAAVDAAEDGDTITLLDDTTGAGVVFENGDNVTIDLNGKTYTLSESVGSSAQYGTVGFYLWAGSNVTIKNGTINMVEDQMGDNYTFFKMFHTYGDLTITDVTLDCTNGVAYDGSTDVGFIAVESDNGTVVLNGNTSITNCRSLSPETWTVTAYKNGKINIDTTGIIDGVVASYGNNASVEIKNGTFTNAELVSVSNGAITVVGGTYDKDPIAWVAEGYQAYSLGDSLWSVKEADATVTVTFESNGKTVAEQVISYAGTAEYVNISREGYDFEGWYQEDGEQFDFDTIIVEDITLTAKWDRESVRPDRPVTYKINIEADGVESSHKTAKKGVTVTLTVEDGMEIIVLDKDGDEIELTYEDGEYTFKMPACDVTVEEVEEEEEVWTNPFIDVVDDAYYTEAVLWAVDEEITNGTSAVTFSPDAVCTRAQVVTFLWRAAGSPAPKSITHPFTDVSAGSYYHAAVLWAVENGITNGTSATTFSPDAYCTRGQIVTFLWRSQGSEDASAYNPFVDVANDAYYADAVLWAVENSITNGTGANTFSPDADCTRGQIVTFLYRCLAE